MYNNLLNTTFFVMKPYYIEKRPYTQKQLAFGVPFIEDDYLGPPRSPDLTPIDYSLFLLLK